MALNICFYTYSLPEPNIGGVERVTYNLQQHFKSLGFGLFFLTSRGKQHEGLIPSGNNDGGIKLSFTSDYIHKIILTL